MIKVVQDLEDRGIHLNSLRDQLDTSSAGGKALFHMMAVFAQFERDIISERTKAGLKAARARGHRGGRKPKINKQQLKAAKAMLADPTVTMQEVADTLHVSRATIYRALKREGDPARAKELKKVVEQRIERVGVAAHKPDEN